MNNIYKREIPNKLNEKQTGDCGNKRQKSAEKEKNNFEIQKKSNTNAQQQETFRQNQRETWYWNIESCQAEKSVENLLNYTFYIK